MRHRFWIKEGLKAALIILGTCIFYTFLMYLQNPGDDWRDILAMGTTYLLMFGAMISMILNTSLYQYTIALTLSFGSTRKEALVGLQFYRIPSVLIIVTLDAVMCHLVSSEIILATWMVFPIGIGFFLFMHALGVILGILFTRFGKTALIIFSLLCGVLSVTLLTGMVFAMKSALAIPHYLPWLVLGIGVLAYALAMIPESVTLKRYSVKL